MKTKSIAFYPGISGQFFFDGEDCRFIAHVPYEHAAALNHYREVFEACGIEVERLTGDELEEDHREVILEYDSIIEV